MSTEAVLNESLSVTANQSLGSLMLSARRRPAPDVYQVVEESQHGSTVKSSEQLSKSLAPDSETLHV